MIIPTHWRSEGRKISETGWDIVLGRSFDDSPPVILATGGASQVKINLFKLALSDITNVEVACRSVERKSPWVSQSHSPNFCGVIRVSYKGIIRGDSIGKTTLFDVNTKQFAQ